MRPTRKQIEARQKAMQETLQKSGYFKLLEKHPKKRKPRVGVDLSASSKDRPSSIALTSLNASVDRTKFAKTGFKNDPMKHQWKKGSEESTATIEEIKKKSMRVAIPYNKGATQYITDSDNPRFFGRK